MVLSFLYFSPETWPIAWRDCPHIVKTLSINVAYYDKCNYSYSSVEVFIIYSTPIHTKTAYTLRASCDIITALSPAVSVRKRLLPSVTLSKPCAKA